MPQVTGSEVAIAGIAGTLIGSLGAGWLAYLAQGRSTRAVLAAQRREKFWDKRAELYLEVTTFIEGLRGNHGPYVHISCDRFSQIMRTNDDFMNRISLFGSTDARDAYLEFASAMTSWLGTLRVDAPIGLWHPRWRRRGTNIPTPAPSVSQDERRRLTRAFGAWSSATIQIMAKDLSGGTS